MSITDNINKNKILDELVEKPSFENKLLNIEISGRCNEKCVYCPYSAGGLHDKAGFINPEFFYRVTREARELGVTKVGLYMKGEPLCNPRVYDYVDYLKHDLQYEYVYISTNGLLLNEANMEKLAKAGIDSIKFSVAGYDKKSFIQHHGVDGFDVVNKNIENAYRFRSSTEYNYIIGMFIIVTSYNLAHLDEMKNYYSRYCDEVISDYVIDDRLLHMRGLELLLNEGKTNDIVDIKVPCHELFNRIVIDENGYLLTCCSNIDGPTRVIDISNMSLKEGIYSDEMKAIRRRHINNNIEETVCAKCIYNADGKFIPFGCCSEKDYISFEPIDYTEEIKRRFEIVK